MARMLVMGRVAKDTDGDGEESAFVVEEPMRVEQVRAVHRRSMIC